jgi:hypothetical protein
MESNQQQQMPDMRRTRISTAEPLDELPVFSYRYYRRAMWFHWLTGFSCGMGIGLAQIRLWPHYAPAFVILQGLLLSFALFHVLREMGSLKKRRADLHEEAEKLLEQMKADLDQMFPEALDANAAQVEEMRKVMGL